MQHWTFQKYEWSFLWARGISSAWIFRISEFSNWLAAHKHDDLCIPLHCYLHCFYDESFQGGGTKRPNSLKLVMISIWVPKMELFCFTLAHDWLDSDPNRGVRFKLAKLQTALNCSFSKQFGSLKPAGTDPCWFWRSKPFPSNCLGWFGAVRRFS